MIEPFIGQDGRAFFAAAAFVFTLAAFAPYLRNVLAWRTRPQRASWFIWSVLSGVSFLGQLAEGASSSLVFAGAQWGGTVLVLLLSISRGVGGSLRGPDRLILLAALAGIVVWSMTKDATWALIISCSVSFLGGTATIAKARLDPGSETFSFWVLSFLAACCGMVSVGGWDPVLLLFPGHLALMYFCVVAVILLGRRGPAAPRPPAAGA
ncbi:MAG: hypothetical protein AAFP13_16275 [Pseudomonadota bacterium]